VGINTGLVALGGLTEAEDTLMGAAVNLAARLESAAPPGGLLISHDTYRHVRGLFDVEPQDPVQAKGFDEPVQVYRVLRLKPRAFRTYTRGVEGVETRMVGRESELKYLQDALLTAIEEGEGQVITISGEAGVGKSRLLYEFQNWIELLPPPAVRFFEGRGRQDAQGLPYGLLRNLFEFRFQIQEDESADAARQKLVGGLMEVFESIEDGEMRAHILGQLLGFDFNTSPHLKGVLNDPEQLRNRGRAYLGEYFEGLSAQGPVIVYLEDIHWADDSSLDALNWMGERLARQDLLVVCAARPILFERRPFWGEGLAYHKRLELGPLSRRESRQLVAEVLKLADRLPIELRDLVVEGAEGNPFYLEELIKMLVEDGVIVKEEEVWHLHPERMAEVDVPPTLAGVLQARLDGLTIEERTVLQQASVVGRQFWDRVVAHIQVSGGGSPQLVPESLDSLRSWELIYRREGSTFADSREFIFKHDILREVTYESVLKRLRRVYHGFVADWLIAQDAKRAGEYSGLIAEHLLQAGRNEQAVRYYLQSGETALDTYANIEAEAGFRKALELSPSKAQLAVCLAGLGEALSRQGKVDDAIEILRQAIDIYYVMGEHDQVARLYARLAQVLFSEDYQKAWDACQEGLARLEGAPDGPGMAHLLAEAGRTAAFRVRPAEEIIGLCQRAIEMATNVGDLEVGADALITLAILEMFNNNLQKAKKILEEVVELAESNGLLRIAQRAHGNLAHILANLLDHSGSIDHTMRAIEYGKKISKNYLYQTFNLIQSYIMIGKLNEAETYMTTSIPQIHAAAISEKEFFTLLSRGRILYARGDWDRALEYQQQCLDLISQGGSVQVIANRNFELAINITELNRFGFQGNLSEAETALRENLELNFRTFESCCLLSIIFARQGRFQDAHDWLDQADKTANKGGDYFDNVSQSSAEFELAFAEARWGEAVPVCESYVDILKNSGYRWGWARRLIDLGDALIGRNQPGDRERAEEAYRQSLDMFTEMGAPGYCEVLEARLKDLEP